MEEDKIREVQELLSQEYGTDGSIEFLNGEQLEIWYRIKLKGQFVPKLEI